MTKTSYGKENKMTQNENCHVNLGQDIGTKASNLSVGKTTESGSGKKKKNPCAAG